MFKTARLSTIRFINNLKPNLIQYIDWDESSDIQTLPIGDLVGLNAFTMSNQGKMHEIAFGITIATNNDKNLFRITDLVDLYYNAVLPEKEFIIHDPQNTNPIAKALFIEGAQIHPITRFETRVAQSIQVSALITLTS